MRFLLPLVALCALSAAPLRADEFNITLTGTLSGSGMFTTDGICDFCTPGPEPGGMLTLTISIGRNGGTDAFDITDTSVGITLYNRPTNEFLYHTINSETGETLELGTLGGGESWVLIGTDGMTQIGSGTSSITPSVPSVPEPRSLFLLMPIVAIVGLHWRHQRRRA